MPRRISRRLTLPLVAAACVFTGSVAHAQAPAGHDSAVAEFQQGRRLIENGNCPEALHHLEESIAYESSIGARLSIAECVEKVEPLRAWSTLSDAALLAHAKNDDRSAFIDTRLDELERDLGIVLVVVPPADVDRPGLEVTIDGRTVDRFHLRRGIALGPGAHRIDARAPGKASWSKTVTSPAPGTKMRLPVELVDEAPAASSRVPAPPPVVTVVRTDPRAQRQTVGLVLGAVGVTAIAVGATFGVLALGKRDDLDQICGGRRAGCTASPELVAPARDNASAMAAVSTVSFVVGGAALASGLALYLWPSGDSATKAARVRATPVMGTMHGLVIEGRL